MKKNIHAFRQNSSVKNEAVLNTIGIRGRQAMEFASMNLPILPGFIIDSNVGAYLEEQDLKRNVRSFMKNLETSVGKTFNDPKNPLLLKIVISPNLAVANYPTLHNFGLTDKTMEGFVGYVGENFAYHEALFLINGMLEIHARIAEFENKTQEAKKLRTKLDKLVSLLKDDHDVNEHKKFFDEYRKLLPEAFFDDAYVQLELALQTISRLLKIDDMNDNDTALLIQPMVYGNYGKDSASGNFTTRDIVTGNDEIQGVFFQNKFNEIGSNGKPITKIGPSYLKKLKDIAKRVEEHFKEIRSIRFTIENKKLWLIDQRPVGDKSTRADIKIMLDLLKRKVVNEEEVIQTIKPNQLHEILHPIVDLNSVKSLGSIDGGIAGAPGAAIGRVFFTTEKLLDAYKAARQHGEDSRFILCMPATFAEDVKAIELATGVLSSEGGYAAHASVVARQYGKVSLVKPELKISGNRAIIGKSSIKEGDYVTLHVPNYGEPRIFLGKADLIEPDPKKSGLLELIEIVKNHIGDFNVRANADSPRDAQLAIDFGAEGIGLCRTEHMFFKENRINVFREMIISDTDSKRSSALKKLKTMQKNDFYKIFKIMKGKPVTIRLLDAPLHEFLPHNKAEMDAFLTYLNKGKRSNKVTKKDVDLQIEALAEFNPMLGHRGCRIAVSYPEIYAMQVEAIFDAAYQLKKEKINVYPEIMIPLIMNENEIKLIVYGKKIEGSYYQGIVNIIDDIKSNKKAGEIPYKIGTMIELPGAALEAGNISKYAEFFSFGTNDLTQTTLGLSRDDFNSFMPDYTLYDLIEGNPFSDLSDSVKELITIAVRRGVMTRPKLKKGLCGEHGAVPENIEFCMDVGLDYVSCSSFSVPIANLAVAQKTIARNETDSASSG